jgi:glycosyltransferase involved in cell wall biosynthesis
VLVLGPPAWRKGSDVEVRVLDALLRADLARTATWAGLDDFEAIRLALGSDVNARVELRGRYDVGELADLLATHRVLLFPSRFEGMPVTLLEATRAGIATVGADVPGVRDLLADGAGALVPSGHVEGFCAATAALLADEGARAKCSAAALEVAARYEAAAVVDGLVGAYETVLSVKRPLA